MTKHIHLDFETRSRIDLKSCGMHVYAGDQTTQVLCACYSIDGVMYTAIPKWANDILMGNSLFPESEFVNDIENFKIGFDHLLGELKKDVILIAHNVAFERAILENVLGYRHPLGKSQCTAAMAATCSLPRNLEGVGRALNLSVTKDTKGYRVMMKMCKPRKPTKNNSSEWHESPEDFKSLIEYCIRDVETEIEIYGNLPKLKDQEQKVFETDLLINDRGVRVDLAGVHHLIAAVKATERNKLQRVYELTSGIVNSPKQASASLDWLLSNGCQLPNLQKQTVIDALDGELSDNAREFLEIRQSLSKSSVAKLNAFAKYGGGSDDRARGLFLYHGATTGRWAGKGIQLQNMPRDCFGAIEVDQVLKCPIEELEFFYGDVNETASKSLRGLLIPTEGNDFYISDFAAIEARVLAWVAKEPAVLKAFKEDIDVYKVAASAIYGVPIDSVDEEQRSIGKVAVLALGFQGGWRAFESMAGNYGVVVSERKATDIVDKWRETNPNIVQFWYDIERAATKAIMSGEPQHVGLIAFGLRDDFLVCRLPSGRLLRWPWPSIEKCQKFGSDKITFFGKNTYTNKWGDQTTYGGKLTENIVQAIARDLLVNAIFNVEKAGYEVVMHVHDEIVAEAPIGTPIHKFHEAMETVPDWAKDFPLKAESEIKRRYGK